MKLGGVVLIAVASVPTYSQTAAEPLEFDAVSIRPSDTAARSVRLGGGPGTHDPGRFTCENCALLGLVSTAYSIDTDRISAPGWMSNTKFVVNAKVPAGATKEQFAQMMQNMLADRFKLAIHREQKEMSGYDLAVAKGGPKLRKSTDEPVVLPEPVKRPDGSMEVPTMGEDGYPKLPQGQGESLLGFRARLFYPRMPMETFVAILSFRLGAPIRDLTGLTGKYDFALFWDSSPLDSRRASTPEASLADAVPEHGPTLEQAVESQLGLKLVKKKQTVETIVVDRAEKIPTEN